MGPILPDLSFLAIGSGNERGLQEEREKENEVAPAKPSTDGNDRYFYILHRPGDSPVPRPEAANRIIKSGGVKNGGFRDEKELRLMQEIRKKQGLPWEGLYREDGIHRNLAEFLEMTFDPDRGADRGSMKSLVAWYYLNTYNREPILALASEDELVFRVPLAWLERNVLACTEYSPHVDTSSSTSFLPFAFVTPLVVPLEYRITDPQPLENEAERALSREEITDFVYTAHVHAAPKIRNLESYALLSLARKESKARAERERQRQPPPHINPF